MHACMHVIDMHNIGHTTFSNFLSISLSLSPYTPMPNVCHIVMSNPIEFCYSTPSHSHLSYFTRLLYSQHLDWMSERRYLKLEQTGNAMPSSVMVTGPERPPNSENSYLVFVLLIFKPDKERIPVLQIRYGFIYFRYVDR